MIKNKDVNLGSFHFLVIVCYILNHLCTRVKHIFLSLFLQHDMNGVQSWLQQLQLFLDFVCFLRYYTGYDKNNDIFLFMSFVTSRTPTDLLLIKNNVFIDNEFGGCAKC